MSVPDEVLGEPLGLELLTAELRDGAADSEQLLELLARRFSRLLPHHVRVARRRTLLGGDQGVQSVTLHLGEHEYSLSREGPRLVARRAHRVGGVSLKTETPSIEEWRSGLMTALENEARRDRTLREGLEALARPRLESADEERAS